MTNANCNKLKIFFFMILFPYNSWASDQTIRIVHRFGNSTMLVESRNNPQVSRYFKNTYSSRYQCKNFLLNYHGININASNYSSIVWFIEKAKKAISTNNRHYKKIFADKKNLTIIEKLHFTLHNHQNICLLKTCDILPIWEGFLRKYIKNYLFNGHEQLSINLNPAYAEANDHITAFLSFYNNQNFELRVIKQIDNITYNIVSKLKYDYIMESFKPLIEIYQTKIDSSYVFDLDGQLKKIENEKNAIEFFKLWKTIFKKSLAFAHTNGISWKDIKNTINSIKNVLPNSNKMLRHIANLNFKCFPSEIKIFSDFFKDIVDIPKSPKNFYATLKNNLLIDEKIPHREKIKSILNKNNVSETNNSQINQIKQQLLNVRAFLFLCSLEQYPSDRICNLNTLITYWNNIHIMYEKDIVNKKNIRLYCPHGNVPFQSKNIYMFIGYVEMQKTEILYADVCNNYTAYIKELICPALQKTYFDAHISLLEKL